MIVYQWENYTYSDKNLKLHYITKYKKINVDVQNLFRSLKIYDYLIDYLEINKNFFIKVKESYNQSKENDPVWIRIIKKIWKYIFRVLEYMTEDNSKTQQLMWKYKEEFVMKELGDLTQDGELDFILAIIDDSPESVKMSQEKMNISRSR